MWMDHFSVLIFYHYFSSAIEKVNVSDQAVFVMNKESQHEISF